MQLRSSKKTHYLWRYVRMKFVTLGFFFDRKLSFWHHCHYCHYYTTKSLSTVKAMKLLGNSFRGLPPLHKRLLYRTCVLSIALYGFQLWYYKNTFKIPHSQTLQAPMPSRPMDHRCLQNLPCRRHRRNSWPNLHPTSPP